MVRCETMEMAASSGPMAFVIVYFSQGRLVVLDRTCPGRYLGRPGLFDGSFFVLAPFLIACLLSYSCRYSRPIDSTLVL